MLPFESIARPCGAWKRAATPCPSAKPTSPLPASVVTWPAGDTFRTALLLSRRRRGSRVGPTRRPKGCSFGCSLLLKIQGAPHPQPDVTPGHTHKQKEQTRKQTGERGLHRNFGATRTSKKTEQTNRRERAPSGGGCFDQTDDVYY